LHAVVDVFADEAHAVDAIDATFGGFVGVPDLDRGAVDGLNLGVPSEHDDPVGGRDEVVGELFRGLIGDVDPDLEECLGGQRVDRGPGFRAGGFRRWRCRRRSWA
jgi:hypothetical protein